MKYLWVSNETWYAGSTGVLVQDISCSSLAVYEHEANVIMSMSRDLFWRANYAWLKFGFKFLFALSPQYPWVNDSNIQFGFK